MKCRDASDDQDRTLWLTIAGKESASSASLLLELVSQTDSQDSARIANEFGALRLVAATVETRTGHSVMPILAVRRVPANWPADMRQTDFDLDAAIHALSRIHIRRDRDPRFHLGIDAERSVRSGAFDRVSVWSTIRAEASDIGESSAQSHAGRWLGSSAGEVQLHQSYALGDATLSVASRRHSLRPIGANLPPGIRVCPLALRRFESTDSHYRDLAMRELLAAVEHVQGLD